MAIEEPLKIPKDDRFNLMGKTTNGESSRGYSPVLKKSPKNRHLLPSFPKHGGWLQGAFRLQKFQIVSAKNYSTYWACLKIGYSRILWLQLS